MSPLSGNPEEARDELRLPYRVPAVQPLDLPLTNHVKCLNAFYCPLGGLEGAETLHRLPPPSDRAVVLFDDIVEVLHMMREGQVRIYMASNVEEVGSRGKVFSINLASNSRSCFN